MTAKGSIQKENDKRPTTEACGTPQAEGAVLELSLLTKSCQISRKKTSRILPHSSEKSVKQNVLINSIKGCSAIDSPTGGGR